MAVQMVVCVCVCVCTKLDQTVGSCRKQFWGTRQLFRWGMWCHLPPAWSGCWSAAGSTVESNWCWIPSTVGQRSECQGRPRPSTVRLEVQGGFTGRPSILWQTSSFPMKLWCSYCFLSYQWHACLCCSRN